MQTKKSFRKKLLRTAVVTVALGVLFMPARANAAELKGEVKSATGKVLADYTLSDVLGTKNETYQFYDYDDVTGTKQTIEKTVTINYVKPGSSLKFTLHAGMNYWDEVDFYGPLDIHDYFNDFEMDSVMVSEIIGGPFGDGGEEEHFFRDVIGEDGFLKAAKTGTYTFKPYESTTDGLYAFVLLNHDPIFYRLADTLPEGVTPAKGENPNTSGSKPKTENNMVTSHDANLLVNGTSSAFEAFNIKDNNYFKLRDIAKVLSGTQKQFDVAWDAEKNAINLVSGKAYTEVGGELSKADGSSKDAVQNTSKIYLDGKELALTAYTIDGSNYFKLRDLGQAVNFFVGWDNASSTIQIDTTKTYTAQ